MVALPEVLGLLPLPEMPAAIPMLLSRTSQIYRKLFRFGLVAVAEVLGLLAEIFRGVQVEPPQQPLSVQDSVALAFIQTY
jgi:hypothetical protein